MTVKEVSNLTGVSIRTLQYYDKIGLLHPAHRTQAGYRLYDDDGETFNYENGAYSWRSVTVSRTPEGKLKGNIGRAKKGYPDNIGKVTWRFMTN